MGFTHFTVEEWLAPLKNSYLGHLIDNRSIISNSTDDKFIASYQILKNIDRMILPKDAKSRSILEGIIKEGMKVLVPFATKTINGFVTNIIEEYNDTYELKTIGDIVDEYLCLNKEMMELGEYLRSKTLCTKIAAYQTMLPSALKVKTQKNNFTKFKKA